MPKWSQYLDDDDEIDQPIKFQKIKKGQRNIPDDEKPRKDVVPSRNIPAKQRQM